MYDLVIRNGKIVDGSGQASFMGDIAISGDRHRSGIYQNEDFIEITASSLNKSASKNIETDPLLIGKTYPIKNFGILDIEPSKNKVTVSIHDQNGLELNSKIINID